MAEEKVLAKGFYFKRNQKAPDFVVGNLSLKIAEASQFIKEHKDGEYINFNILKTKDDPNKFYLTLDTWKPDKKKSSKPQDSFSEVEDDDDLPF